MKGVPHGLPGGGPWLILDDCPAMYHNTGNAAKKGVAGHGRCICPRALVRWQRCKELAIISRTRRGERKATPQERGKGGRPAETGVPQYVRNMRQGVLPPDLSAGSCRSVLGRRIMDSAQDSRWSGEAMAMVRAMCEDCPVQQQCAQWAADGEDPPGAWIGVYGGLVHWERRNAAKIITEGANAA